jgi:hypothetical protein
MDVLKWAALVFAAGFIGYFGRYLGKLLIQKFHRSKPEETPTPQLMGKEASDYGYKLEKKRLKLEKKKSKKTTDSEVSGK